MEELELRIVELEQRLRPMADRPVDITQPGWDRRLMQSPHPLDAAGVRTEAELLLQELIAVYPVSGEAGRQAIRRLFEENRAFAWAASLSIGPVTKESFRQHLLLFSMKDQERDGRDALLWLQELCRQAIDAGIDTAPILQEVAALSSSHNRYGMGSTREMLINMA